MECETCKFWGRMSKHDGLCRRHAPKSRVNDDDEWSDDDGTASHRISWPRTFDSDFCGDWMRKPKEPWE